MSKTLRLFLAVAAIIGTGLIGLAMFDDEPAPFDRARIVAEREHYARELGADMLVDVPLADCAAAKISRESAENILLIFVNQRGDTLRRNERRQTVGDVISAYEACGMSDQDMLRAGLSDQEVKIMRGIAIELIQRGNLDPAGLK